jgi:iron-sulfur cluster assembly protein
MLVLSETASTAIRQLIDRPELPDTSGLRIAPAEGEAGRLGVSTAGMPEEGDQVIEDQGARVFLEPGVAEMLDDQVLDATADDQGRIGFVLSPQ